MRRFICYNSIIAEREAGMLPERMDTSWWMGRVCAPFVIEDILVDFMDIQSNFLDESPEYIAFVNKFKPKRTTDECYTPPAVYEVVKDWACNEYGIDPAKIVRPFYPGGDYERYDYSGGAVVLDNPPFSMLSNICAFYLDRGIPFFLFAPSLTAFGGKKNFARMNHVICDANIVYENGAVVNTAFVTSYGDDVVAQTAPELGRKINDACKKTKKTLQKYEYPDHIVTAARMNYYAAHGISFNVRRSECMIVGAMDSQRHVGKAIYGSGLLLSDSAAERKAAAEIASKKSAEERARAEKERTRPWELSAREKEIIKIMNMAQR